MRPFTQNTQSISYFFVNFHYFLYSHHASYQKYMTDLFIEMASAICTRHFPYYLSVFGFLSPCFISQDSQALNQHVLFLYRIRLPQLCLSWRGKMKIQQHGFMMNLNEMSMTFLWSNHNQLHKKWTKICHYRRCFLLFNSSFVCLFVLRCAC